MPLFFSFDIFFKVTIYLIENNIKMFYNVHLYISSEIFMKYFYLKDLCFIVRLISMLLGLTLLVLIMSSKKQFEGFFKAISFNLFSHVVNVPM